MQMDLKICGISQKQFALALQSGVCGITHVLSHMNKAIKTPRDHFKTSVPIIEVMELPAFYKRGILFRAGAYNAKLVESETGVRVSFLF